MGKEAQAVADDNMQFFYTEEVGLALFMHRRTGQKFCIDRPIWEDLVSSIKAGWQPWVE